VRPKKAAQDQLEEICGGLEKRKRIDDDGLIIVLGCLVLK